MHKYLLFIVQLVIIVLLMMFLGFIISMFFPTYSTALIFGFGGVTFGVSLISAFFSFDRTQEIMRKIIRYTLIGELLLQLILSIPG